MRILRALSSVAVTTAFLAAPGMGGAARAAELVMVEQVGCHWCERWDTEISQIYPKTSEGRTAPLRRVDLYALPADIAFASRPVFTPTFVLVQDGAELGRLEGYNGDEFFWFLLGKLFDQHAAAFAPAPSRAVTQ